MSGELVKAIADLKEDEALRLTREMLNRGEESHRILEEGRGGMEVVGQRFGDGTYFLPELVYSAEILKQINALVKPVLKQEVQVERSGKCIIGTVAGDIHDIGKDIVVFMLDVSGFEVHDLGVDVPPQKFVEKIQETGAPVVGLSGFLTLAFDAMKQTVEAITTAGLRDKVKIMIGGGQVDEQVMKYAGADACGSDAMSAVTLAKTWLGES
jgi:5-methyltetrahydrofolate--homocysteine methyltransferase